VGRQSAPEAVEAWVRQAGTGDAGDVAALLDVLGYPCSRDEAAERIALVQGDRRQVLLLAECEGRVQGLVAMETLYSVAHGSELARITALVVDPACERKGVGRRLLREVEQRARQAGIARIEVTSNARRSAAHAFYRGCGYADGSLRFVKLLGD
jgi:GNAT superfamily N-acetyltransferase